jgi:putative methylase
MSSSGTHPPVSRRQLAIQLEKVPGFMSPDERLEQYSLDAEAAANLLWTVKNETTDLASTRVLDLGCGTGILTLGAALIGASLAVGVDLDSRALERAHKMAHQLDVDSRTDWVRARIPEVSVKSDLVVQNPPFGVKRRGSDLQFLKAALSSSRLTYSIHLASQSGREYLQRFIEQHGGTLSGIIPITVRIRHTLPKHRKRLHNVNAEIYKITVK